MLLKLPYGKDVLSCTVPDENFIGVMDPPAYPPLTDLPSAIEAALDSPYGEKKLEDIIRPGKTVAIIIDDGSRPTPISAILPILLGRIEALGTKKEDISIVAALGSHRYMTEQELCERVGADIYRQYKVMNSEFRRPEGLTYVGKTPEGVDILASKCVMDCDIHIGIGCLVPHPVMGWGGGGKILYPGIAGEKTVAYFHLKASLHDENMFGLDTTPIRDMMESWVDAIGLDFIINVVLNAKQQIADVVAGHYVLAHRAGVQKGKRISGCRVTEKADVVVVSSHPADQDFWQSPKAMYAAERALKGESGGTMILVSPNYEGVGPHPEYPELMGKDGGDAVVEACIRGEAPGDPLAIAVGNSMSKMRRRRHLVVVGDGLSKEDAARCGCDHYYSHELQKAVEDAMAKYPNCRVSAVSHGAETFLYE